jgi:hypothetical protein
MKSLTRFIAFVLIVSFVASAPVPLAAATTDTFRDEFNNQLYSNNDGTALWTGDWTESESPQDPTAGSTSVQSDGAEDFALFFADAAVGDYVERTVDLSGFDAATLTFDYRQHFMTPSVGFEVQVSEDGSSWDTVWSMWGSGSDVSYLPVSVDLSAYVASPIIVRFTHTAGTPSGFIFHLDNIEIAASAGNVSPTADATNSEPYVINEGDSVTLDGSASSDPELAPLTFAWDLDNDGNFGEPGEPVGTTPLALVPWATLQSFGIDDDGSYQIGLRVTDDALQSDTTTTTLTVNNTAPTISVAGLASVDQDAVYTLNLSAADPGNETISGWTINWGDGTIATVGDVSSATHVYSASGFTRNITVSVTDEDGTFLPGDVLVASLATDSLFRFDATSGGFLEEFADLNGLGNPIDVEIGPDGRAYASGFASNDITRYDATTGAFVDQFIAPGSGGLSAPARMVFGPDGNLYISNYATDEVLRFDGASGAFIDAFVSAGSGTLNQPDGITFGPDGNLYVVSGASGRILRYDGTSGAFIDIFALIGSTGYADLAFGPDSNLYVSSVSLNKVQRFDGSTGVKINDFVAAGSGGIGGADGLAFGPDGYFYVVGFNSDNVKRYDAATGAFVDEYVSAAIGMNQPINLVFTPAEQVRITAANNDPVAIDDADTTAEDTAVIVYVLSNDTDPELDPLDVDSVTQGLNGSVVNNGSDVTYTPDPDWNGVDTFTYTVTDGNGGFDTATVTVTVSAQSDPPVAVDDADSTAEDTPVTVDVLVNDTDPDLDSLSVSAVTSGPNGSVVNNGSDVTYTPTPGWSGIDTFTYTVSDGNGGTDIASVTVTVGPVNDDPTAMDDTAGTVEDTAVTVDVLANDTDPELDPLTVDSVTQGANGSVVNNGTNVTYDPDPDWNGTDTFTYTAADGNGGFATATATITVTPVNDDPVAVDDTKAMSEDSSHVIPVLGNDSDPDGHPLTVSGVIDGTNGSVTNNGTDVTYTPNLDWSGTDTFMYTVSDGNGGSASASVTVTVTPVNDDPQGQTDATSTPEDTPITIDVLANDTDVDSVVLTIAEVADGAHGTVTTDGLAVTYTPDNDWNGTDTFTYRVTDDLGGWSETGVTVTVTPVNDNPVAVDDMSTTPRDTPVYIWVLDNDTDVDPDMLSVSAFTNGAHGIVVNNSIKVTYSPASEWTGTDTFTYTVSDGNGGFSTAIVTVTVAAGPNRPPVANDDTKTTDEDAAVTIPILANDSDPDGDAVTVSAVNQGAHGSVTKTATSITYAPAKDWSGIDSFSYSITDGRGGVATAAVVVTVRPVNDAPNARDDAVSTPGATTINIPVLANDVDPDGDSLTLAAVSQGAHGVTTINGTTVGYSPSPGWVGTDSFAYTIADGHGGSDSARVTVTVGQVNRPPVITVTGSTSVAEDAPLHLVVSTEDPDRDTVSIAISGLPDWANVVDDADGGSTISGIPGFDADPSSEITISASDGTVTTRTTIIIEVIDVNRPPLIGPVLFSGVNADGSFSFMISASDPDGDPLTISISGLPPWATLTDYGDGSGTVSSAGVPHDALGSLSVVIAVTDGQTSATSSLQRAIADLRLGLPPELTHQAFDLEGVDTLVATSLKPQVGTPSPLNAHLTPREGLLVAFGSAVETLKNQILPALVLGVVMAWMLMIGVGRIKEEEEPETA